MKEISIEELISLSSFRKTDNEIKKDIIVTKVALKNLKNKEIPEVFNKRILELYSVRNKFIEIIGYAPISKEIMRDFKEVIGNKKCLEIMSGCGVLAKGLQDAGVNVIATDNFSWNKKWDNWTEIENIDCIDAIEKYGKEMDFIICSWAYMDDTLYKALLKMREVNPKCEMIVIGEHYGGCTADDDFFKESIEEESERVDKLNEHYHSWDMIYDRISIVK